MNITVVITNRNYGDMVTDAVMSAYYQEYVKNKVVVMDDGSTDNSREVYKKFPPDVKRMGSSVSHGPAAAKNAAIDAMWDTTDFFAFLDADDLYLYTDTLYRILQCFTLSDEIGIVYCDCNVVDADKMLRVYKEPFAAERFVRSDIVGGNIVVSKRVLQEVKFAPQMKVWENYDLVRRAVAKFTPIHLPEALIRVQKTDRALSVTVDKEEWQHYWDVMHAGT